MYIEYDDCSGLINRISLLSPSLCGVGCVNSTQNFGHGTTTSLNQGWAAVAVKCRAAAEGRKTAGLSCNAGNIYRLQFCPFRHPFRQGCS